MSYVTKLRKAICSVHIIMTSARKKVHADNAINNKQSVNLFEMLIILIKGSFILIVIQTLSNTHDVDDGRCM